MLNRILNRFVHILYQCEQHIFDWYYGVATAGAMRTEADALNAGSENWPYMGCQWPVLPLVLKDLKHEGTFVDLGSGKGKALVIAAKLPYQRVVGVEINDELAAAARNNIERFRPKQRAGVVECVTSSATTWVVPDDTSVVFLFNPFFGATFKEALENVFASYDRNPRELHIVYGFPWEHEWLLSTGRVTVESVRSEGWPRVRRWWESEHVWVTYHVTGVDLQVGRCQLKKRRLSAVEQKVLLRWSNPGEHNFDIGAISSIPFE
jgi:SAM-dependent methyltransferase